LFFTDVLFACVESKVVSEEDGSFRFRVSGTNTTRLVPKIKRPMPSHIGTHGEIIINIDASEGDIRFATSVATPANRNILEL